MDIRIRNYQESTRSCIVKFMKESQDYLTCIDQMKRTRRMPNYGEIYTRRPLKEIDTNEGIAYVAEHEDRIIGFVAGVIQRQSKEDLLEYVSSTDGRILELFVDPGHRRQNVGTMLMQKIEGYFKQKAATYRESKCSSQTLTSTASTRNWDTSTGLSAC
jgi:GNAT superfamily N-acetyltransferase